MPYEQRHTEDSQVVPPIIPGGVPAVTKLAQVDRIEQTRRQ